MARHFLLSKEAADLNLDTVIHMSEDRARVKFRKIVWEDTKGKPVCPPCGGHDHWELVKDAKWKCKGKDQAGKPCRRQFSPTTDTIFHAHKLSYRQLLKVCALFTFGVNGVSAMMIRRLCQIDHKSAFVLLHKIREALGKDENAATLGGVVEMDGAVFGRDIMRMPNDKSKWEKVYQGNKAAARKRKGLIVVIRERPVVGSGVPAKVRTFVVSKEGDAVEIARKLLLPDTVLHVDCSTQWLPADMYFDTKRINHSEHYSFNGACTNFAESFFSRMRTGERGIYKHISGTRLALYAMELGWREQFCRKGTQFQFERIVRIAGQTKRSDTFKGYWRKRPRPDNDHGGNDNDGSDFFAQFA